MRRLLRRLVDEGTTIFVSSHLLAEVDQLCDRVGVLAQGKLVAEGTPTELRAVGESLRIEVDDTTRARRILATLPGVSINDDAESATTIRVRLAPPALAESVNASLVGGGVAVRVLVPERATLEDVFVALVEGHDAPR